MIQVTGVQGSVICGGEAAEGTVTCNLSPVTWITLDHLHSMPGTGVRPGWCHRGARAWCLARGLDWQAIVAAGGIEADTLIATGDAFALALVQHARACNVGARLSVPLQEI
ncbi:hypothetical protein FACS1894101_1590 [Betaproteobacteria bacterium]|nr:hypothetical protein FACS1894101_1590 [Betaproteobacteria bacterium]